MIRLFNYRLGFWLKNILIFIIFLNIGNCKTITIEEIRFNLRNNLKQGDSEKKVLLFIHENNIYKFGPIKYRKYMMADIRDSMNQLFENIDEYNISYYITGVIKNSERGFFVHCDIYMRFYFDNQKLLQGFVSNKICTGP